MEKDSAADPDFLGYKSPDPETIKSLDPETIKSLDPETITPEPGLKYFSPTDLDLTGESGSVQVALQVDDEAKLIVEEKLTGKEETGYVPFLGIYEVKGTALWNVQKSYKEFDKLIPTGRKYKLTLEYRNTANLTKKYGGIIDYDGINVFLILLPVDIVADTNRDGFVNSFDNSGKDQWTKQLGTIYAVNLDNDNPGTSTGLDTLPDAISWWDLDGSPKQENWTIENDADVADMAPLQVTIPNLPYGSRVFLTAGHLEQIHAVHIFGKIEAGAHAIWGGILTKDRPWTDADAEQLDIEISGWLNPTPSAKAKPVQGTYTLGVEGLVFRGMKIPNGTLAGRFGGLIELGLEIQPPGGQSRVPCGKVQMKVAPFLLTPNDRPTDSVFVLELAEGLADKGSDPQAPKPMMPKAKVIAQGTPNPDPNYRNPWMQDHAEIGYTQRPGGPLTKMTFVCPNAGLIATWPAMELFSPNKGIFALGKDLSGDVGDFGGNIELTHPQANHPMGRIVVGNSMGSSLKAFLEAQEIQALIVANVNFTEVEHIDEVLSTGPGGVTYVPDPAGAIALLEEKFDTVAN